MDKSMFRGAIATATMLVASHAFAANISKVDYSAAKDRIEAAYKVAAEKCDSLAGDAKASCLSAAKARFNKS